ncbi:heat shock cognate 70 kDa protein isoform X1 [Lactuca sativa]|nr:heat shock cognate 70 kDa protein isoform X1 [Lactuca sativa]XP_052619856.1 heat shock cognate 70 kDa protein isoform X1 [Lactuca sativa]
MIGRRFNDPKLQQDMKLWPFQVIKGANNIPKIALEYKDEKREFFPEEISSMVLMKLKEIAEAYLGDTVLDVVITVPAYFDDSQRQATKDAAFVAGLNVLQIINEPTSAAIAYGLDMSTNITRDTNVLVFDLGGGTFDVSLVTIDKKGIFKVKAVAGDTNLGGQDFDNLMVNHFVKQFNEKHKKDISGNIKALGRLKAACEKSKRVLSSATETILEIDALHEGVDFSMKITRAKFEHLNQDFFTKCIKMVESCLHDANLNKKDVDEVVLVGGSTRIPKVQQLLKEFFNGKELCKKIDADEAVAYGASVLAAKLSGNTSLQVNKIHVIDVIPLSLGVNVSDGSLSVIVKGNTPKPTTKERGYVTSEDNQQIINFDVYQGERFRSIDNNWLGNFQVPVPRAPKGKSAVKVVFNIDVNGILNCSGEEVTTGLKTKVIISHDKQRLSREDIKKMILDAQRHERDDDEYRKMTMARKNLEDFIDDVKRKINDKKKTGKTRIKKEDMEKVEKALEEARKILNGRKLLAVKEYNKASEDLNKLVAEFLSHA